MESKILKLSEAESGITLFLGFLGDSVVKNPPVNAGAAEDEGSIPEL